eukprot:TRINITY_DN80154_c0_g1_i1.p1 TRINITY_DN80154_c0_g1~~TRINITY_DN80154_c0_g1_i1.p1  ORF type:complete len:493 (+),score=88.94 TRINITY_DN80154_c0_g1_i1:37-1515(+)
MPAAVHKSEEMARAEIESDISAKIQARIDQLISGAGAKGKVAIHSNQMEYTFLYAAPLAETLSAISLSPLAQKREMIVRYMRTVVVVRVPARPTPEGQTEIMIPLEQGKHAMVHSSNATLSPEEIELCAQLQAVGNSFSQKAEKEKAKGRERERDHAKEPKEMKMDGGKQKEGKDGKDDKEINPEDVPAQLEALGARVFFPPEDCVGSIRKLLDHDVDHLWSGIAGYAKVKASVKQIITLPLLRPDLFAKMAQLARGKDEFKCSTATLFTGPPGVGKTSMAKVAAHAAGVPLVYVPVEGVMSKYYGEAEQRLGKVFELTRHLHRAVLFLDELDAFAGSREGQMHEATRRILSVLLRQIDGLDCEKGSTEQECPFIVTVGATNRPTDLDSALLSRFEQCIEFTLPTAEERAAIFGSYASVLTAEELARIAEESEGFAGRDIVEVCHHAERIWLYRLLNGTNGAALTAEQLQPPPADVYLEAVVQHKAGNASKP